MKPFIVQEDCQIIGLADIYKKYFAGVDQGFFVEVGALDGRSFTNTGFLADIGWNGIYIEPVQQSMDQCRLNHKNNNVIFEQCAIGETTGYKDIYVSGGLSTFDPQVKQAHDILYQQGPLEKQTVLVQPLSVVLDKYQVSKNFELLVVDTEGYEQQVFNSFDVEKYRPKMIIVELVDIHEGYNNFSEIQANAKQVRQQILTSNYKEIYTDCINTIFWRNI